jgi:hypothetical protein
MIPVWLRTLRFFALTALLALVLVSMFFTWVIASIEIFYRLLTGWFSFPFRTVPYVTIHWTGIASALLTVFATAGLGHFLMCRMTPRWRWAWTTASLGVIGLMFIAGLAFTGLVFHLQWIGDAPLTEVRTGFGISVRDSWRRGFYDPLALAQEEYRAALLDDETGCQFVLIKCVAPWNRYHTLMYLPARDLIEAVRLELKLPDTRLAHRLAARRAALQPHATFQFDSSQALAIVLPPARWTTDSLHLDHELNGRWHPRNDADRNRFTRNAYAYRFNQQGKFVALDPEDETALIVKP